jgi:hypothetical protein
LLQSNKTAAAERLSRFGIVFAELSAETLAGAVMRAPAERALLALAVLCMAGAAIGLYVQRAPKPETTAVQEPADEEPRRFPLPAGPRKYQ